MFKTIFDETQLIFLAIAIISLIMSLLFHQKDKEKSALFFLVISAVSIYSFAALLDPFINLWDERFHALVAKNLMNHPLMPTLYEDPILNIPYNSWVLNHVWVHKQPLFLWQIALSFKIFGVNEFALRLPSVIMCSIFVIISYRTGKILVNKNIGYYSGLLIATSFNFIELVAGRQNLDHNDIAFIVYISLSLWAWIEYIHSPKKKWLILIGLFSGFSILCKWLVGLLIYLIWFIYIFQKEKWKINKYKGIFVSLLITILISVPWQIFIFIKYPYEANIAYGINLEHFSTPLNGHSGTYWYYIDILGDLYGRLSPFFIIPALYIFYQRIFCKKIFISMLVAIITVNIFFTMAQTKMPSFTLVISLPIFLALGCLIDYLVTIILHLKWPFWLNKSIVFVLILFIIIMRIDLLSLAEKHTLSYENNYLTRELSHNKKIFQNLNLPKNTVLFNTRGCIYIDAMFYTGLPVYGFLPSEKQYNELKNKGRTIAIFNAGEYIIEPYLKNAKDIIFIQSYLKGTYGY